MRRVSILVALVSVVCGHRLGHAQEPAGLKLVQQTGHSEAISSVVFASDGKHFLTGSDDNTAILWEIASGKSIQSFQGHTNRVTGVAISGDRKRVATSSFDETVILWDVAGGKRLQTFQTHSPCTNVSLTDDGKHVFSGSFYSATFWESASGKNLRTLWENGNLDHPGHSHSAAIACSAMSGDGNHFVTGAYDKNAVLWDVDGGKVLHVFRGHTDWVKSVALSGDGKFVATGSTDTTAILWDRVSGEKIRSFGGHFAEVVSVALTRDGRQLVAAPRNGIACLWDTTSGKKLHDFDEHTTGAMALSPDGKLVVTGCADGSAILWETASGKKLQTFQKGPSSLTCLAVSVDGKHLVTGSTDRTATLWDLAGGKRIHTLQGHANTVSSVAVSGNGKHVVTGSWDGTAILWDVKEGGKKFRIFNAARGRAPGQSVNGVLSVTMSSDGNLIATGSDDGKGILWDADSGKMLRTFPTPNGTLTCVALSGDGDQLLTGFCEDGNVDTDKAHLWKTASGEKLQTFASSHPFPHGVTCVAVSPRVDARGGKHVVTNSGNNLVILWDVEGNKLKTFPHAHHVGSVAVSGDGKHVATAGNDYTVRLWQADRDKESQILQANARKVALSGDGKHLWTAGHDGTTRLWDPSTGKERCRLISFADGNDWLVVTPEGHFDGSPGAWRFVTYRIPGTLKLIDDDATRRRFHRPGLLAEVWKQEK